MMMRFLLSWVLSAVALAAAAGLLGEHMNIGRAGDTDTDTIIALALVALVFSLVNTFIAPIVKTLSLPFIVLTLGLFLLVINALLLMLTDWIAGKLDVVFYVESFGWAVLGAIIISIVNAILGAFVKRA
ncbi:phage holin family protein [Aeromicrobium sp.]|uniref:phage holin family protein n=1 Tax=Aeromicrobium sp. TaxID=1871063 RepID=UPI003D6A012A